MLAVPREAFVPAKTSTRWPISTSTSTSATAGSAKRFLIKPVLTAKMLQAAEIAAADNVLIVGCATGYAAAIAAKLAGKGDRDGKRSGAGREG